MLIDRVLVSCIIALNPIDGVDTPGIRKKLAHALSAIYWRRRLAQTRKTRDPHEETVR